MTVLDRISVRPNADGGHQIVVRSERPGVPATQREINPNPHERYNEPRILGGSAPHNISRLRQSGRAYGAQHVNESDTPLRLIDYRPSAPYPTDSEPAVRSGLTRRLQHSGGYYDAFDEPAVRDGPVRPLQRSGNYSGSHDEPVVRSGPVRHHQHSGNYFNPYEDSAVRGGLISPQQYTYNPYSADREPEVLEGRVRRPRRSGNDYDPFDEPAVRSGATRPRFHSGHYGDPYENSAVRDGLISPQQYTYNQRQGGYEPEILEGAGRRPQPQSGYYNLPTAAQPVLLPNGTTVWAPPPPAPNARPAMGGHVPYVPLQGAPVQYQMQGRQQFDPRVGRRGAWGSYGG